MVLLIMNTYICSYAFVISWASGYENLALDKPTWQSKQYSISDERYDSSNAVDGLKTDRSAWGGQCVISDHGQRSATWWVNLTTIVSIHDVTIYYRTDNVMWDALNGNTARFLGFFFYVSNTTERLDGHLCFHDTNYTRATIPAIINMNCMTHGQYVIYFNERPQSSAHSSQFSSDAHNELCEVEVYGCSAGYYGSNCSLTCPDRNCRYCHIETGICLSCYPGYSGNPCESGCSAGWEGNCLPLLCGNCNTCNAFTGQCTSPCNPGWKGQNCIKECDGRKYGQDCGLDCGACLDYKQCHHINGSCLEGCDAGFEGNRCKRECVGGRYGQDCNQTCGACLNKRQCHHINGSCPGGCDRGYRGELCKTGCSSGTFGFDCLANCSTDCVNGSCHPVYGYCPFLVKLLEKDTHYSLPVSLFIGGTVGCLVLITLITITVYVIRRKNKETNTNRQQRNKMNHDCGDKENYLSVIHITNESNSNEYEELGDLSPPSDYTSLR